MSKYYIYQMTAVTEDGSKGSYIGQHKIGRKCPLEDGYKGSGIAWKKYILSQNIPVEKVILRMCDNIEEANYWENYYIEKYKNKGIYLWNRCKGGGSHEYNKQYTNKELKKHRKEYYKRYREANKEHIVEQKKRYYEANKEHYKQWREANKEHIVEYNKLYHNQLCLYNGETLTLTALRARFRRAGIEHSAIEAKKYIITDME